MRGIDYNAPRPHRYADPDVSDAEHLAEAAWHLYRTGASDLAGLAVERAVRLFDGAELAADGRYHLGAATYAPAGILSVQSADSGYLEVPAPSKDIGPSDQERDEKLEKKRVRERAVMACANARCGWFPERQVVAALDGKPLRTPSFMPAKLIRSVMDLCGAAKPGMDPAAYAVLADKLTAVMDKNPMGGEKITKSWLSMIEAGRPYYDRGGSNKCVQWKSCPGKPGYSDGAGFAWFEKDALEEAVKAIRQAHGAPTADGLRNVPIHAVAWRRVLADFSYPNKFANELYDDVGEMAQDAGDAECVSVLRSIAYRSVLAARDLADMIRAHQAIIRCGSEYLLSQLEKAKIVEPELEIPADLLVTASVLRSYGTQPERAAKAIAPHPDLLEKTRAMIAGFMSRPDIMAAMSWDVLKDGSEAGPGTDGQAQDPDVAEAMSEIQAGTGSEAGEKYA